jgi:hypothetical protein
MLVRTADSVYSGGHTERRWWHSGSFKESNRNERPDSLATQVPSSCAPCFARIPSSRLVVRRNCELGQAEVLLCPLLPLPSAAINLSRSWTITPAVLARRKAIRTYGSVESARRFLSPGTEQWHATMEGTVSLWNTPSDGRSWSCCLPKRLCALLSSQTKISADL